MNEGARARVVVATQFANLPNGLFDKLQDRRPNVKEFAL
jgi:hypothetical protein